MRMHRIWFEIVICGSGIACALALLFAIIAATAGAAVGQMKAVGSAVAEPRAYEGMVTCNHCGARHSAKLGQSASTCVRVCVHGGAQFALVNAESVYLLEGGTDQLKRAAGERVKVIGRLEGNTIKVQSVVAER